MIITKLFTHSTNSRAICNRVRVGLVLVALLTLFGFGRVYGDPYESMIEDLHLLRNHINELEERVMSQEEEIRELKGFQNEVSSNMVPSDELTPAVHPDGIEPRLASFKDEVIELIAGSKSPLKFSGFFDFTLQDMNEGTGSFAGARSERERIFDFGSFELDLAYSYGDHYSVSAALVWDSGPTPKLAVGMVDYHLFDDDVPVRGRIFDEPGFHIQIGRFDIPYGVDYQYFPSVNRPNVTAPLTTTRIQRGGFNSDGVRFYGTWKSFDYTGYATNTLYGKDGVVMGGRVAFLPLKNLYRLNRFGGNRTVEFGFSYLKDMDKNFDKRDQVFGFDFTLNYDMFTLIAEWMTRDSDTGIENSSGVLLHDKEQDASAFYISLVANLEEIVKRPLYFYSRYDEWDPNSKLQLDTTDDTTLLPVKNLQRMTVGLGYSLTESLGLKLEYFDYLGQGTKEPSFNDSAVTLQVTARF